MKEIYERIISDVAMEISVVSAWRKKIFMLEENEILEISFKNSSQLPDYVRDDIVTYRLTFFVKKEKECPEEFDKELIIFKFWSKE